MNGIQTIRPSRCETDLDVLTQHLCEVLLRFRNRKTARDLIGDDERSDEFGGNDLDVFADALCAGMGLTVIDRMKVRARSQRLADARLRASDASDATAKITRTGKERNHG